MVGVVFGGGGCGGFNNGTGQGSWKEPETPLQIFLGLLMHSQHQRALHSLPFL